MLATKRYLHQGWKNQQILHSIIGTLMTGMTVYEVLRSLRYGGRLNTKSIHSWFGVFLFVLSLVVYLSGVLGVLIGRS